MDPDEIRLAALALDLLLREAEAIQSGSGNLRWLLTQAGLMSARARRSELLLPPPCHHDRQPYIVGIYGASDGNHEPGFKHPGNKRGPRQATTAQAREIMGMPWAKTRHELTQAIPPAYAEWVGERLLASLAERSTA